MGIGSDVLYVGGSVNTPNLIMNSDGFMGAYVAACCLQNIGRHGFCRCAQVRAGEGGGLEARQTRSEVR